MGYVEFSALSKPGAVVGYARGVLPVLPGRWLLGQ